MKEQRKMQTELEKKITDMGLKPDNALSAMRCVGGFMGAICAWYDMATDADKEREIRELKLMLSGVEISMFQFGISENDLSLARRLFIKEVEHIPVYIARAKKAEYMHKRRAAYTLEQIEADKAKARNRMRILRRKRKLQAVADNQR